MATIAELKKIRCLVAQFPSLPSFFYFKQQLLGLQKFEYYYYIADDGPDYFIKGWTFKGENAVSHHVSTAEVLEHCSFEQRIELLFHADIF